MHVPCYASLRVLLGSVPIVYDPCKSDEASFGMKVCIRDGSIGLIPTQMVSTTHVGRLR